jgi:probable rRNA maturation factor
MVTIKSRPEYKFDRELVEKTVEGILFKNGITDLVEVGLLVVGVPEMKKLHKKYMETDEVTDVLSFPTYEKPLMGDIVICYPVAVQQAKANGKSVNEEMAFLAEHSCLHLLGIHHE